jgi:glycosyltransferase involved in cell wall biosynthesis
VSNDRHPAISVILPWCDRDELARTYPLNSAVLDNIDAELIVVNSGGNQEFLSSLGLGRSERTQIVDARTDSFNKCLANNIGVHCATAKYVFLLDADIVIVEDFFDKAMDLCDKNVVVSVDRVRDETGYLPALGDNLARVSFAVRIEDREGRIAEVCTRQLNWPDGSRNGPGLVFLRRRDFLAVDGMNAYLKGWGWEDIDLLLRLQLKLGLRSLSLGTVAHINGGRSSEEAVDKASTEVLNRALCLSRYSLGDYGGTLEDDVRRWLEATVRMPEA